MAAWGTISRLYLHFVHCAGNEWMHGTQLLVINHMYCAWRLLTPQRPLLHQRTWLTTIVCRFFWPTIVNSLLSHSYLKQ